MNERQVAELTASLNGLNKTIMLQQQAKVNEQKTSDNTSTGSRRRDKDEIVVKLDDNDTFKQLKGLLAEWHKEAVSRQRAQKGGSPTAQTESNRRLTGSINNLTKNSFKLSEAFEDLTEDVDDTADSLDRLTRKQNESNRQHDKTIMGHIRMRQEIGKLISESIKHRTNLSQQPNSGGGGNNSNKPNNAGDSGDSGNRFASSITSALEQLGFKVGSFMTGVTGYISDTSLAMKTGSQYDYINTTFNSASMGLSTQEYLELGATYRTQAMRLANGTNEWMASIKSSQRDLIAFTGGDMLKAAQIYSTMNARLMDMGFGLDEASQIIGKGDSGYVGTLKRLNHATGKTIDELDQFVGGILTSDQVRSGMFKLDREQRSKFLATQTSTIQSLFMMTGSLDRAKDMIDVMNKRQDMTGLDRIRDAVKASVAVRVLGGSSKESQRMIELSAKRPESLSKNEYEELMGIYNRASQSAETKIGKGGLAMEISVQTVMGRLSQDLEKYRMLNTTLDQPVNDKTLTNQSASSLTDSFDNPQMKELLVVLEVVKKSLGSNLSAIIVGGFASVLAAMGARGLFDRFGGSGTRGGTTGTAGGTRTTLGNIKNAASFIGKGVARGGIVGAGAYGATYALDEVWNPVTPQEQIDKKHVIGTLEGATIGAAIGSVISPVLGTAVGGIIGGLYGYFDSQTSPIAQSAAQEQERSQLLNLEREFIIRKHNHELESIELFKKTMTTNELDFFNSQVDSIESQYGVKIKNINDLTKYENDELRKFVDVRSKMLTERQQIELDHIDKKYAAVDANYQSLTKMNDAINVADKVQQLADSVHTWNNTHVSGEDLGALLTSYDSKEDPANTLQKALNNMDPVKLAANGWDSNDMAKVMDAVIREKNIDRFSKEGKLAEALVWEVEKMAVSTANSAKQQYESFLKTSTTQLNNGNTTTNIISPSTQYVPLDISSGLGNVPLFNNTKYNITAPVYDGSGESIRAGRENLIDQSKQRDYVEQLTSDKKAENVQYILDPRFLQELQMLNRTTAENLETSKESVRVQSTTQSRKTRANDTKL